jgi:hypothetical protein
VAFNDPRLSAYMQKRGVFFFRRIGARDKFSGEGMVNVCLRFLARVEEVVTD